MPRFSQTNDTGSPGNQLSGDTFVFTDPSDDTGANNQPMVLDTLVVDGVRDFLFPTETGGTGSNQNQGNAHFDNLFGFYEVTDTNGGANSGAEDDIIA